MKQIPLLPSGRGPRSPAPSPGDLPAAPPAVQDGPRHSEQRRTFYEEVGGRATFEAVVDRFYAGVVVDEVLAPLYPPDDVDGARERLTMFLEQYWGGPTTYSAQRGHPRLRMRHAGFRIGPAARDAWIARMREAVESVDLAPAQRAVLWEYLERAAHSLLNTFEN